MNTEHPITPPPELRQLWAQQAQHMDPRDPVAWQQHIATQAARWGADQELEACVDWIKDQNNKGGMWTLSELRAARRPKPLGLKEMCLMHLSVMERDGYYIPEILGDLRRALEQLDD